MSEDLTYSNSNILLNEQGDNDLIDHNNDPHDKGDDGESIGESIGENNGGGLDEEDQGGDDDGQGVVDEWCAFTHEETGRRYFCNDAYKGGEAVWTLPEGVRKYIDTEDGDREIWLDGTSGNADTDADAVGAAETAEKTEQTSMMDATPSPSATAVTATSAAAATGAYSELALPAAPADVLEECWSFFRQKDAILEPGEPQP